MRYEDVSRAVFLRRPNRFIAQVELDGREETVHVKNTGRCAELLTPGVTVWVSRARAPKRRTQYDLITVDRGGLMVNMDSQAPNRLFAEWAEAGGFGDVTDLKPEQTYGASRIDFSMMRHGLPTFVEVKGVTLEREGAALFPDAPTERGVRHLRELIDAKAAGYGTAICFVIQMKGPAVFRPNRATHPAFADALREASAAGVRILALDCVITPDSARIDAPVPIDLE